MKVHIVQHTHTSKGTEDVKVIGIYSSMAQAEAAITRLRQQPGFRDAQAGFHVDEYRLDEDHWAQGYVTMPEGRLPTRSAASHGLKGAKGKRDNQRGHN